jgi:DNA primase
MYESLIRDLQLEKVKVRGKEILACCPFAALNHLSGKDSNPSFSLNVEKGIYNCFSCGEKGVIEELVMFVLGVSRLEAISYLEGVGFSKLDIAIQSLDREMYLPSGELDFFIPEAIVEAFTVIDKHNEIYQGDIDGYTCLIYIVRNYLKAIVGAVVRAEETRWHKNIWGLEKRLYLYGENKLTLNEYPIVVVEGVGDALSIRDNVDNYRVVALMGAYASNEQVNKLLRFSDNFIVWLDNDAAGYRGAARLFKELERRAFDVRYVSPYDIPDGCKDPRDVFSKYGSEKVKEILDNAQTYLELQEEQ